MQNKTKWSMSPDILLQIENLQTYVFDPGHRGFFRILDGVSFRVPQGKTVAVVGESGSGKTRMIYSLMGLVDAKPGIIGGHIYLQTEGQTVDLLEGLEKICEVSRQHGRLVVSKDERRWSREYRYEEKMRNIRGKRIALIMQEAKSTLSPYQDIYTQAREAYMIGHDGVEEGADETVKFLLRELQILDKAFEYPHNLSGGTCHRAMMVLSFAADPDLLIADEPTTGLDCPLQVKVLELLYRYRHGDLFPQRKEKQRSLLLITHQLEIVEKLADELVVLYGGKVLETGSVEQILKEGARHPYTRKIINIYQNPPALDVGEDVMLPSIPGAVPSPLAMHPGCRFLDRCEERMDVCAHQPPHRAPLEGVPRSYVYCHLFHPFGTVFADDQQVRGS